jgi:hypothetical protein
LGSSVIPPTFPPPVRSPRATLRISLCATFTQSCRKARLIDDARQGRLVVDDQVVFIYTRGTPAVFAYRDELLG